MIQIIVLSRRLTLNGLSLIIFKLNVNLFPDSYNAFDSYAEALLKIGDKEAAIINYKKSVDLNPGQKHGKRIKELGINYG